MTALHKAAQQALDFCEFLWREVTLNDYAEELRHETEVQLIAALADHSGDATEMVTTEPVNLLRLGLAQALRGIADGFDAPRPWWRPWSRPDPLIMRTLRRAADELDKEDV